MPMQQLEDALRVRLAGTLPGVEAQRRFVPSPIRPGWRIDHYPDDARIAAALLLLYPLGNGIAVPLTVRASGLARHAGQISLPGGATDQGETLAAAALREASEEIAVDPSAVRVLGELTPVHVLVSGFTLHPIVAVADVRPAFIAAPGEVEEIVEVRSTICATPRGSGTEPESAKAWPWSIRTRSRGSPGLGRDRDGARGIRLPARRVVATEEHRRTQIRPEPRRLRPNQLIALGLRHDAQIRPW
jgi:8-oxo-dGTP pyrophosphatase MutT (NUDIX family)